MGRVLGDLFHVMSTGILGGISCWLVCSGGSTMTCLACPGTSVHTVGRLGPAGFLSFSVWSPGFPRKGAKLMVTQSSGGRKQKLPVLLKARPGPGRVVTACSDSRG